MSLGRTRRSHALCGSGVYCAAVYKERSRGRCREQACVTHEQIIDNLGRRQHGDDGGGLPRNLCRRRSRRCALCDEILNGAGTHLSGRRSKRGVSDTRACPQTYTCRQQIDARGDRASKGGTSGAHSGANAPGSDLGGCHDRATGAPWASLHVRQGMPRARAHTHKHTDWHAHRRQLRCRAP